MKVKITKTINLAQLPMEIRTMLDRSKNELVYGLPDQLSAAIRAALSTDGEEFFKTIELIDKFRQGLASFDENLQEIQNVLTGYKSAIIPPEEKQEVEHSEEWLANEQAEYEKKMSQTFDAEEGFDEEG
jgi:hypothetical protein